MRFSVDTIVRLVFAFTAAIMLTAISGCYTPPEDYDSQMPWSTPQDWESSPMMPGMGERY